MTILSFEEYHFGSDTDSCCGEEVNNCETEHEYFDNYNKRIMDIAEIYAEYARRPTELCTHCMTYHGIEACFVCNEKGHSPIDCPLKCPTLVVSQPLLFRKVQYKCLELGAGDDHICAICDKVWRVLHIDAPIKRGAAVDSMCGCGGRHCYEKHSKLNCLECSKERTGMVDEWFKTRHICIHKRRYGEALRLPIRRTLWPNAKLT